MVREISIRTQDNSVRMVPLDKPRITLGRSAGNDLVYPDDAGLSRLHMVVERRGDDWYVEDKGSKNGTLVNSIRISEATRLQPGDRVTAGHLVIEFGLPVPVSNETVIFVDDPQVSTPTSSTVITSLEGLLKGPKEGAPGSAAMAAPLEDAAHVKALIEAGQELSVDRPLEELFQLILDRTMRAVGAARGAVMTNEENGLIVRAARGENMQISKTIRDKVLIERHSLLIRDTQLDDIFKDQISIVAQRVRSFMAVPLQTRENVIGLLYLDSPHMVREFTKGDLNLVTVMANIAAIRIENSRLVAVEQREQLARKELEQAAKIQRQLLPESAPVVHGVELAGFNAACRTVGGDYYDFFNYPDGRVLMLCGDVAGKGMPAALLMSSLQARVQVLAEEGDDLATMMTRLNRAISAKCPDNRFITLFIAALDPKSGELSYCNAGHNPPVLVRANGDVETLEGGGIILGIMPKAPYSEMKTRLEVGDILVLYSDGVTEAANLADEEFGEDRLAKIVLDNEESSAAEIIEIALAAVTEWIQGAAPADDVTLVVARRTAS